jgi:hypothetical protein
VKDVKKGNLLSGPCSPDNFNVFDGQGAPEVFLTALNEACQVGGEVYVLGVGKVTRTSPKEPFHVRDNPVVKEFCSWDMDRTGNSVVMKTRCLFDGWEFTITKMVLLTDRTITSQTIVDNHGKKTVPILWFAHPFFPVSGNPAQCKFSTPVTMGENVGYCINNEGFIERRNSFNWKKGLYQKIACAHQKPLSAIQLHPAIGNILVTGDFIPDVIAIWANDRTFSFEPFFRAEIEPGEKQTWGINYKF